MIPKPNLNPKLYPLFRNSFPHLYVAFYPSAIFRIPQSAFYPRRITLPLRTWCNSWRHWHIVYGTALATTAIFDLLEKLATSLEKLVEQKFGVVGVGRLATVENECGEFRHVENRQASTLSPEITCSKSARNNCATKYLSSLMSTITMSRDLDMRSKFYTNK